MAQPRLGDVLVQAGVLTREQVDHAIEQQKKLPGAPKIGEVLLAMGLTTENAILDALSRALHMPAVDLPTTPIDPRALKTVPADQAEQHLILPVRFETEGHRRRLVLAMADPTNVQVIDEVQFKNGLVVKPVVTTASQIRRSLEQQYGVSPPPPMRARPPEGSPEQTWTGSAGPAPREPTAFVARIEIVGGPGTGKTVGIPEGGSRDFGRGDHVDVSIPGDKRMSRRHFILIDTGKAIELVDLGSRNGTSVNQQPAKKTILKTGDSIEAGDTLARVSLLSRR